LGIEESMAILKGDWVVVEKDTDGVGGLGRITCVDFNPETHLVWLVDGSRPFAILRHKSTLTKIDSAFNNLLTDVYKESV
jgi:hypothetical protein